MRDKLPPPFLRIFMKRRLLCRIGIHSYGPWGKDLPGWTIVYMIGHQRPATRQECTCIHCGKLKFRFAT